MPNPSFIEGNILLKIESASLSGISMLNSCERVRLAKFHPYYVDHLTSSIAITTSTVSKLSRPKSFEKCDVFESLH